MPVCQIVWLTRQQLLAQDFHLARGSDAELGLIAFNTKDSDRHFITDPDGLVGPAGYDEHGISLACITEPQPTKPNKGLPARKMPGHRPTP